MSYGMQVKVSGEWLWVCPTGGKPYSYETEREASNALHMCYPDQLRAQRLGGEKTVRVMEDTPCQTNSE